AILSSDCLYGRYYFFFQAEDGIRVFHVTGVQTCALPILSAAFPDGGERLVSVHCHFHAHTNVSGARAGGSGRSFRRARRVVTQRSEERRVGKEGRAQ